MTKVRVLWDNDVGGWFCRIKFANGQEIDSCPPVVSQFNNRNMSKNNLMELVFHSLSWENNSDDYEVEFPEGGE